MKQIWQLIKLFKGYKLWVYLGLFLSLVSMMANISLMGVSGWFITLMGLAGVTGATVNYFTPAALIRGFAILRTGGRYGERIATHEATFRIIAGLRAWFYSKLQPLNPSLLNRMRSGDLLNRMRQDIDQLERFYLGFLVPFFVAICSGLVVSFILYLFNAQMALYVAIALAISTFILPFALFKLSQKQEAHIIKKTSETSGLLSENLQGLGELMIYDQTHQQAEIFKNQSLELKQAENGLSLKSAFSQNAVGLITGITLLITLVIGAPLLKETNFKPEVLAFFSLFILAAFEASTLMPVAFQSLGGIICAFDRIFSIANQSQMQKERGQFKADTTKPFSLKLDNLSFGYHGQQPLFTNLNLELKQGEKLAIVGPTGVGKSSLLQLMLGFEKPTSGSLYLQNQNTKNATAEEVLPLFAVLEQKPYIFAKSIEENLKIAKPNATEQELNKACEDAGILDFIQNLPQGYKTFVGENGSQLSGGQIKRIALARALLKDAPCLILDEPGEGLDYQMEADILNRVLEVSKNKAVVLITHRHLCLNQMNSVLNLDF